MTKQRILQIAGLAFFCLFLVLIGGGMFFIKRTVGLLYILLVFVWASFLYVGKNGGAARAHHQNENRIWEMLYAVYTALFLFIFPVWEYGGMYGFPKDGFFAWIGLLVFVIGALIQIVSVKYLDRLYTFSNEIQPYHFLVTGGPYKYVRHPIYSGFIVMLFGSALALGSLIGLLALVPVVYYTVIRISAEEEKLLWKFGEKYKAYAHGTKKLIPFIY